MASEYTPRPGTKWVSVLLTAPLHSVAAARVSASDLPVTGPSGSGASGSGSSGSGAPGHGRRPRRISVPAAAVAYAVHLFTGLGAILGLFSLYLIHLREFYGAFWLMAAAIFVDAVDGTFARRARVKEVTPNFDGALLDNLIDYLNYAVVPAFFVLVRELLPGGTNGMCAAVILVASAYQFSRTDAKTSDHYFKGFPSYWNIAVFYLEYFALGSVANLGIILSLAALSFVPIKYLYPSRLTYFSESAAIRAAFLICTILWGVATAGLLWLHPASSWLLSALSLGYVVLYTAASLYRTLVPIPICDEGAE